MYFGAHVSIAGGFDKCIDRAVGLGSNCLMTFASSPRSLQTRQFSDSEIKGYLNKKDLSAMGPHFFHGVYLINLASDNKDNLKAGIDSLIFYQQFAAEINAIGTIFHLGSHKGRGLSETIDQVVASVNFILDSSPKNTKLIMENAAGQANTIGQNFDELAQIIARVGDRQKIGICLDIQHAFAAGYDLKNVLNRFDKAIGLKYLTAVHINDSLSEFNSHIDRHANIGEGLIGLEEIKAFINDPRIKNLPMILETPGADNSGPRAVDVSLLKSLKDQA